MPEHVRMRLDLQAGSAGGSRDDPREASRGERATPLAGEDEGRLGLLLALQPAQGPQFVALDGVRGWGTLLRTPT
jgi:hypothetical protein